MIYAFAVKKGRRLSWGNYTAETPADAIRLWREKHPWPQEPYAGPVKVPCSRKGCNEPSHTLIGGPPAWIPMCAEHSNQPFDWMSLKF